MLVKEKFFNDKKIICNIFFLIIPISSIQASIKQEIIANLKKTNNLVFDFKQTIAEKEEKGSCTIEYPKKIYCLYNNRNKKIMVSNGRSLVIKNQISNQLYFYRLKQTPLDLILDKDYLINQIENLKFRIINDKYVNFSLINNNNQINIFFDKKTLNLIGWQTEDIYQNLTIFFISNIKINEKIDKKIFTLPKLN